MGVILRPDFPNRRRSGTARWAEIEEAITAQFMESPELRALLDLPTVKVFSTPEAPANWTQPHMGRRYTLPKRPACTGRLRHSILSRARVDGAPDWWVKAPSESVGATRYYRRKGRGATRATKRDPKGGGA